MKRVLAVGLVILAATTCIRLGVWQLSRLAQRRALNAAVMARVDQPPQTVVPSTLDTSRAFQPVRLEGEFDLQRQIIVAGRPVAGVPGVFIVTPLRLPSGDAVLVERGWSPSTDARTVDLAARDEAAATSVNGVLIAPAQETRVAEGSQWPRVVVSLRPEEIGDWFPYRLSPWLVRRADAPSPARADVMRPIGLPDLTEGPHLSYALQWFAFAIIIVAGSIAVWWVGRREARDDLALPSERY